MTTTDDAKRRGHYLPLLPEGWRPTFLTIEGPGGAEVNILAHGEPDPTGYGIAFKVPEEAVRTVEVEDFDRATRAAVVGIRRLERLRTQLAEIEQQRQEVLTDLGEATERTASAADAAAHAT